MPLLQYYLVFLATLTIIYLLGKVLCSFFILGDQNKYLTHFIYLFVGSVVLVFLFSLITTGFKTINLVLVPLAIAFMFMHKIKWSKPTFGEAFKRAKAINTSSVVIILLIGTFFFCLQAIHIFRWDNVSYFNLVNSDTLFSSKISEYLNLTGNENIWQVSNLLGNESFTKNVTYHYGELWLNAFIIRLFGVLSAVSVQLLTYPLIITIFALGLLALMEHFLKTLKVWHIIIAVLLVFFKGFYTIEFLQGIKLFWVTPLEIPKLSFIYVYGVAIFLAFIKERYELVGLLTVMMPVAYFTILPGLFGGVCVAMLVLWMMKRIKFNMALKNIVLCVLGFGAIMGFYAAFGADSNAFFSLHDPTKNLSKHIKTAVNIVGGTSLQIVLLYALYGIIAIAGIILYKKNIDLKFLLSLLVFAGSIIFISLACWGAFNHIVDSPQLFQNISVPILNIFFITLLLYLYASVNKRVFRGLLISIFGFNALLGLWKITTQTALKKIESMYSLQYMDEISKTLKNDSINPIGVSLFDSQDYKPGTNNYYINHLFSVNTNTSVLGAQLKLIKPYFNTLCISPHNIPKDHPLIEPVLETSLFYQYVEKQKKAQKFKSISQSRLDFIDEFNINYVIVTKFITLSPILQKRVDKVIKDPLSGERFILLKKKSKKE